MMMLTYDAVVIGCCYYTALPWLSPSSLQSAPC